MSDIDVIEMVGDLSDYTEEQLKIMKKSWKDELDVHNKRMLKCRSVIVNIQKELEERKDETNQL